MSQPSLVFIEITHNTNLATYFTRYDDTPSGAIVAEIFRNMDLARAYEFFYHMSELNNEVGAPSNVVNALVYYINNVKAIAPDLDFNAMYSQLEVDLSPNVFNNIPSKMAVAMVS